MNKETTVNVTTPLLWPEEDALQKLKKLLGVDSTAGVLRLGLYGLLERHDPATAKKLVRVRLAAARQAIASVGCLLLTSFVWWQSANGGEQEFRRPSRGVRVVRLNTGRGNRKEEFFAAYSL